jgi:hypothetical protein
MSKENLIEGEYDGSTLSNELLYQLVFEDLYDEDKELQRGKPMFWNNGK